MEDETEDDIGDAVLTKQAERANARQDALARLTPGRSYDPQMGGSKEAAVDAEVAAAQSEGTPIEQKGTRPRPMLAVGVWAQLASVQFKSPVYLSGNAQQLTSARADKFEMYLLTNRTVKVIDFKKNHVYVPCENVSSFTVLDDDSCERRIQA